MAYIYNVEPNTNGKVVLHTTNGDIDIELWADQAPIACRNFVQLCMEGYYNKLKGRLYGLLCEKEKEGAWEKFLDTIIVELMGF